MNVSGIIQIPRFVIVGTLQVRVSVYLNLISFLLITGEGLC